MGSQVSKKEVMTLVGSNPEWEQLANLMLKWK